MYKMFSMKFVIFEHYTKSKNKKKNLCINMKDSGVIIK